MADMSDPHEVMKATVDHCRFHAASARRESEDAATRAAVWNDAADQAAHHLREFTKWNPRPPFTEETPDAT